MRTIRRIALRVAKFFRYGIFIETIFVFLLTSNEIFAQSQHLTNKEYVGWIADDDEKDIMWALGDEEMISIASGYSQPVSKAPSVATVITAEDIKAMGATELSEVLESVPGLHVSRRTVGYNPKFLIRGIETEFNPQILVLINGIPITNIFHGDRNQVWGGMSIEAISRVEVIRGPGSAIYGADAFSGVINIITKTIKDISEPEFGVRFGRFSTREAWFLGAENWKGLDIAFMIEYHESDGQDNTIERDQQTLFDADPTLNTTASLAPGPVNLGLKRLDTRLDISRGEWRIRAGLQKRWDVETGAGLAQALDPEGRFASDRWNVDLTYHNPDLTTNWDLQAQFSFLDTSQEVEENGILFPPGTRLFIDKNGNISGPGNTVQEVTFTNGVIGAPEVFERHFRFDVSSFYSAFENHHLRLGAGLTYSEIYKVIDKRNFGPGVRPVGILFDKSDTTDAFLPEKSRRNIFFFTQDEWSFANDWTLTAGVRYDHYSDFGDTVNPRVALIWTTTDDITTKLLYGRAFRAPAFAELFEKGNPVALGNEDLDPETIESIELAFDYRLTDEWRWDLNLFYYRWDEIIRFLPVQGATPRSAKAKNSGEQTGFGLELETDWQLMDNLRLIGNYAFQQSEDEQRDEDPGNSPQHQLYLRTEWEFIRNWIVSSQMNWVIDRDRPPGDRPPGDRPLGDIRPDIDDYIIFDLTLRRRNIMEHLEIALSVRNVFDEDAREPSPSGSGSVAIPNDLPLADRSIFVEARFLF